MSAEWLEREAIVIVKAYPNPSAKYFETVCVAAITAEEGWVRLYPANFRSLFDQYESEALANRREAVKQVADLVLRKPSTLLCLEADADCCHRSRLAIGVAPGIRSSR